MTLKSLKSRLTRRKSELEKEVVQAVRDYDVELLAEARGRLDEVETIAGWLTGKAQSGDRGRRRK